jgi:hypothetical protein
MDKFFITDKEQTHANFGNYEFMTKLKIKHTLAALGIEEQYDQIMERQAAAAAAERAERAKERDINQDQRNVKKQQGGRSSLRRKKRKSTKRGSSLRRKKRKSTKRRKS